MTTDESGRKRVMYEDTAETGLSRYNRDRRAPIGTESVTPSGYRRRRVEGPRPWRYVHHLVAEEILHRPLAPGERVTWRDGDRLNCHPTNLLINMPVKLEQAAAKPHRNPARTRGPEYRYVVWPGHALFDAIAVEADLCGMTPADWLAALAADELGLTRKTDPAH